MEDVSRFISLKNYIPIGKPTTTSFITPAKNINPYPKFSGFFIPGFIIFNFVLSIPTFIANSFVNFEFEII